MPVVKPALMRIQGLLKFSLDLMLPQRLTRRLQGVAAHQTGGPQYPLPDIADGQDLELRKAQRIIEDIDHGEFGGPSFGPQTMQLMAQALLEIRTDLPEPASDAELNRVAVAILANAAEGERDLERLKSKARAAVFAGPGTSPEF